MATKTAAPVADEATEAAPSQKKKRGRLLVVLVVLVALVAAAAYVLLGQGSAEAAPAKPEPGSVLKLDAINVNLADGHYLKLGLALQLTKDTAEAPDGSRALDLAIDSFSNRAMGDLSSNKERTTVKEQLLKRVSKAYDGAVMDVYFTEFVMQ